MLRGNPAITAQASRDIMGSSFMAHAPVNCRPLWPVERKRQIRNKDEGQKQQSVGDREEGTWLDVISCSLAGSAFKFRRLKLCS
jgi:hypothetical protein